MLSCFFRNRVFLFLWAAVTGFLFAIVWKQYEQTIHETLTYYRITPSGFNYQWAYRTWLTSQGLRSTLRKSSLDETSPQPIRNDVSEDRWLAQRVSVLCIVLSKRVKQARAVKNTWAKHCNSVSFFGEFGDSTIPVNRIKAKDGWHLLCEALRKVWKSHGNEGKSGKQINWILVASDRTYAIVENLRYMVAGLDWNESFYLGHTLRDYDGQYNVHDAGYALSWGAMTVLGDLFAHSESCSEPDFWRDGDRTLGQVLQQAGINCRDTRDVWEKSRFLPYNLEKLLIPGSISVFSNYWRQSSFLSPEGSGCCSDFVITLSDVSGDKMYMLEYIVYHLKPVSNHWPISIGTAAGSRQQQSAAPKIGTTTTRKPQPIGKAFIADISTGQKKKNVKAVVHQPPSNLPSQKDEPEIEVIVGKEVVRPPVNDDGKVGMISNGHMNKVGEMIGQNDIEDFADGMKRADLALERDGETAIDSKKNRVLKDDFGSNHV